MRTLYRIRVFHPERVPHQGGALLVANHVSWVDSLILAATQQRRIRFVMSREVFMSSRMKWLFKLMQAILISEKDSPKQIILALKQAQRALDDGYLVCIFPEGTITRNGTLGPFKAGVEHILKGTQHPILPFYLDGLWGSIFSYARGKTGGWPARLPYPVNVHFGALLPATTSTRNIRTAVQALSCDAFETRKAERAPLGQTFIKVARRNWSRRCISDRIGRQLTYGRTLIGAHLLAKRLGQVTPPTSPLGIMLPSSVGGALANIACTLSRQVSVNLNFTNDRPTLQKQIDFCNIKTVVTSRAFLEKVNIDTDALPFVFLEDLLADIRPIDKLLAALQARWAPKSVLCAKKGFTPDECFTMLFSSGSSGRPKAIMLSHHNLLSNLEQMRNVFPIAPTDHLSGVLPLFHSFGLNITLWLPLTSNASVDFVPNPLDTEAVAASVRETQATVIMSPPTFLLGYLRRIKPEDFASLRRVIVGAEKLKPALANSFEKRFGVRPMEGYGATELSPLVSLNLPTIRYNSNQEQIGNKAGSVGLPVPGIALQVRDPETQQPLDLNEEGVLWIEGPNVMLGYWRDEAQTETVLQDGWYNTGDIVRLDDDGFITITDRLSRFSKIGGEMVSHGRIEQVCLSALDTAEPALAVTGIPDERKGERLVVLYVADKVCPDTLFRTLADSDLPNMYKPKRDHFVAVPSLPFLGSGKLDLRSLKRLASEALA